MYWLSLVVACVHAMRQRRYKMVPCMRVMLIYYALWLILLCHAEVGDGAGLIHTYGVAAAVRTEG